MSPIPPLSDTIPRISPIHSILKIGTARHRVQGTTTWQNQVKTLEISQPLYIQSSPPPSRSLSLSLLVSVCLSLSTSLSIYVYIYYIYTYLSLSLSLSFSFRMHIHVYTWAHTLMCVWKCICICICIHVYVCMQVCKYEPSLIRSMLHSHLTSPRISTILSLSLYSVVSLSISTLSIPIHPLPFIFTQVVSYVLCIYIYVCICICTCMYAPMYTYIYIYIYTWYIYIYMSIDVHIHTQCCVYVSASVSVCTYGRLHVSRYRPPLIGGIWHTHLTSPMSPQQMHVTHPSPLQIVALPWPMKLGIVDLTSLWHLTKLQWSVWPRCIKWIAIILSVKVMNTYTYSTHC